MAAIHLRALGVLHDPQALRGPHGVDLQGDLALVAGKWGSFAVCDVSDPADTRVLGSITEDVDDAQTVMPLGRHCLLGTTDSVLSIDLSEPRRPRVVHRADQRAGPGR